MPGAPSAVPIIVAFLGLFLGGGAIGLGLAGALASGSRLAEVVSFFALPFAFAAGLQAWLGLALFALIPRLLGRLGGSSAALRRRALGSAPIPGSFVFVPISAAAGGVAGLVAGLASSTHAAWLVTLAYWLVGTVHGLVAWRLARAGFLIPPESL